MRVCAFVCTRVHARVCIFVCVCAIPDLQRRIETDISFVCSTLCPTDVCVCVRLFACVIAWVHERMLLRARACVRA